MSEPTEQLILDDYGPDALAALKRAVGPYSGVGYYMGRPADPEKTARRAWACADAEEDAIHVLKDLRDWCDEEIKEILEPSEVQDERRPFGSRWRGSDDVVIALARLADARNDARPAR